MSNVYILPRNRNHNQRGAVISSSGRRRLTTLSGRPLGTTRLVRTTSTAATRRVMNPPHASRLPMMPTTRRVYLAPAAVEPVHVQQHFWNESNGPSPQPAQIYTGQMDQSEEDEFDMDEVYSLLEESAGHRLAESEAAPRRRERLTNLTAEEKLNRRKQKNRVAAQAARDRKKETTKRLEDSLKRALLEIGRLKSEVKLLRSENVELREQPIHYGQQARAVHAYQQYYQQQPAIYPQHQQVVQKPSHRQQAAIPAQKQPQSHGQQQQPMGRKADQDSLGSAASFYGPQPWERESQLADQTNKCSSSSQIAGPLLKMGKKERQLRMACVLKVLLALWSVFKKKRETTTTTTTTSPCNESSTSFLKSWTFQSMWTASATRSLKRELLRRMLRMDKAKLQRLSSSPQQQLVANLLVRKSANRKARGRQRSADMDSSSMHKTDSTLKDCSNLSATQPDEEAVVPQLRRR